MGDGLSKLKHSRKTIDRVLRETIEFNERITDPDQWNRKLRQRQREELDDLRKMRDRVRCNMITRKQTIVAANDGMTLNLSEGAKPSLFDQNKSLATKIFKDTRSSVQQIKPVSKKAAVYNVMDSMDAQAINELEERDMLDILYRQVVGQNYKDDKILDSLNKRIKHMNRVRKLKREQEQQRKQSKMDVQHETQVMIETLMMLCDPYMQQGHSTYKKTVKVDKGPSFLQRLEKDQSERATAKMIRHSEISAEGVKRMMLES